MLDNLVETIKTLKERIDKYKQYIEPYESRTRVALIDPMLCALGWDVADPACVEIEPSIGRGWADYALLDAYRNPIVLIEAKKLEAKDADDALDQATMYLLRHNRNSNTKVFLVAYTNGKRWVVVDVTKQDSEPIVMDVSLDAIPSPTKCALRFLALWRSNLQDGSFTSAAEPLFPEETPPTSPAPEPQPVAPAPLAPQPSPSLPSASAGWVSLTDDFATTKAPSPIAIHLPNGEEKAGKNWRSVIIEAALWLHREGKLTEANCNIPSYAERKRGHGRFLLNRDGKHPSGVPFKSPVTLGDTNIILEANYSASDLVDQTCHLLRHFNIDPATVHLKFP